MQLSCVFVLSIIAGLLQPINAYHLLSKSLCSKLNNMCASTKHYNQRTELALKWTL